MRWQQLHCDTDARCEDLVYNYIFEETTVNNRTLACFCWQISGNAFSETYNRALTQSPEQCAEPSECHSIKTASLQVGERTGTGVIKNKCFSFCLKVHTAYMGVNVQLHQMDVKSQLHALHLQGNDTWYQLSRSMGVPCVTLDAFQKIHPLLGIKP